VAQQLPPLFAHVYCGHGRPSQLLLSSCGIFGRNVSDKISNQKTRSFAMSPQIMRTSASALHRPGKTGKHENHIHFFHSNSASVHCQNSTSRSLISSVFFDSRLSHTHAAVRLPKSCSQCVQLGAVGGVVQEKGSRERCSSWTVLHAQCMYTSALSS